MGGGKENLITKNLGSRNPTKFFALHFPWIYKTKQTTLVMLDKLLCKE